MINNFNLVLYQPEIAQNIGNIGKMCVGSTNATLHIIKPRRFFLTDKYLKIAGLDYWDNLKLFTYNSLDELIDKYSNSNFFFCTTKSKKII